MAVLYSRAPGAKSHVSSREIAHVRSHIECEYIYCVEQRSWRCTIARLWFTILRMRIIGHGVDVVQITRIEAMLAEHGERFIQRCFTSDEQAYAEAGNKLRVERYAARFAAKEAVLKALGTGWSQGTSWRDIGVIRTPNGQPGLVLTGRCAELASELQITQWHISLSHTADLALASVIACG